MSPVALGTACGAAALTVGRGAAAALASGLSFGAELLRAGAGQQPEEANAGADKPSLPIALQRRMTELAERIRRQLAAAGFDLTRPTELTSNGLGGIAVHTDDPLGARIQEALGQDLLLERDFDHLAADYADFVSRQSNADFPPTLSLTL